MKKGPMLSIGPFLIGAEMFVFFDVGSFEFC